MTDRITVPISDYAEMVMQPEHDSAQAVLNTLGNPYRYAHCLDQRA